MTARSIEELASKSAALLPRFSFQELRLDYLPHPLAAALALPSMLLGTARRISLATCRRIESGGQFHGSAEDEVEVLAGAARGGCALVDLALETAEALGPRALDTLRDAGALVGLSFHDFSGPCDLEAIYARMVRFAPDFCKIVPTANCLGDNLGMLRFLGQPRAPQAPRTVGLLMGEAGLPSRVLGVRAGSAFTFAAAESAEATAPGQVDALTLLQQYRFDSLDAHTELYGVAGDPIASSKSPIMFHAAFDRAARNAVYLPLLTHDAEALFRVARELPLAGFSVTMPLKQAVLSLLDHIDPLAVRIGAVNTVRRAPDGSFSGCNTDVAGIVGPLEDRLHLRGARVLVLGAGGAARAAVFGCADRGAEVSILNRTYETAAGLAAQAGARALRPEELGALPAFDVLIQATPAGMRGNAATLLLDPEDVRAGLVFETVYNPLETPLLRVARRRGIETIAGIEMFVRQGAEQFALWTGEPAPVYVMREAVLRALHASSAASPMDA